MGIVAARDRWLNDWQENAGLPDVLAEAAAIAASLIGDGLASMSDLESLAIAGAPPSRVGDALRAYEADAAMTAAVLAGWRDAGMPEAGRAASKTTSDWADVRWDGLSPTDYYLCHAARLGGYLRAISLTTATASLWAKGGALPPAPDDFASYLAAIEPAAAERTREELRAWSTAVPHAETHLWVSAGYTPDEAARLHPMPLQTLLLMGGLRR